MISVVVYGRNDGHGYNMHRRVALSLNCIAEILKDSDDEIIFVDYNTPDGLPSVPQALSDTLTDHCLSRIRIVRVPAAVHAQRFGRHTHLPIVEPVARNCGVRRSNPANRWILSTTTDMVFTPHAQRSLSEICGALEDGFYALPRFELPEWVWESLGRSDPRHALAEISRLGRALALDEPTTNHEWVRFDAPGDFQLALRDDLFAIDGFDERMLLGWHVDSNLSRRLLRYRGSIETLEDRLAGYHCNHTRTVTIYHETRLANDLERFFYRLDEAQIEDQRTTWGLADVELEEIEPGTPVGRSFAAAIEDAIAYGSSGRVPSDAREAWFALEYDSAHVLAFVADEIRVASGSATIGYLGANPVLTRMLVTLVRSVELGSLLVADSGDEAAIAELDRRADLFIVDLGVDASLVSGSLSLAGTRHDELRTGLVRVFDGLRLLVERERLRLAEGRHPRRFVLVNSSAVFWNGYVLAELNSSATTPHSRVRRALVKNVAEETSETEAAQVYGRRLLKWISRWDSDDPCLHLRRSEHVRLADLEDYSGFGAGWRYPDPAGIWTQGYQSELRVAVTGAARDPLLVLRFDDIGSPEGLSLIVDLLAGDHLLDTYEFNRAERVRRDETGQTVLVLPAHRRIARAVGLNRVRPVRWVYLRALTARARAANLLARFARQPPSAEFEWRVRLPAPTPTDSSTHLTLRVREPAHWRDERHLGLYLTSVGLEAHQ